MTPNLNSVTRTTEPQETSRPSGGLSSSLIQVVSSRLSKNVSDSSELRDGVPTHEVCQERLLRKS